MKALSDGEMVREALRSFHGYAPFKMLDTREWAGVMNMVYTCGLFVGIKEFGYRTRYCYETRREAEAALEAWNGDGDPPGMWIKQKPEDRLNPAWLERGEGEAK